MFGKRKFKFDDLVTEYFGLIKGRRKDFNVFKWLLLVDFLFCLEFYLKIKFIKFIIFIED